MQDYGKTLTMSSYYFVQSSSKRHAFLVPIFPRGPAARAGDQRQLRGLKDLLQEMGFWQYAAVVLGTRARVKRHFHPIQISAHRGATSKRDPDKLP